MKLLVSCPYGLWSLLANEIKKIWLPCYDTFHSGTFVITDMIGMMKINLRSRLGNKVFIKLTEGKCISFDQLFNLVEKSAYPLYTSNNNLSIKVQTKNSILSSTRTIQSIAHKALLTSIANFWKEEKETVELFITIENNIMRLYLNSSGKSLHQRAWRKETWAAPIKENLAVALLLLAWRRFKSPLIDPFCGSGTIAIEAALLAKNIAPGLKRHFAFEHFKNFEKQNFEQLKTETQSKTFNGNYHITACDKDPQLIEIARKNAKKAWVAESICFETKDFLQANYQNTEKTRIITNPPYGKRLQSHEINRLYQKLEASYTQEIYGWFISTIATNLDKKHWSEKKLFNGNEKCSFWRRKIK